MKYNFVAERPDELSARYGEPVIIMAHSAREWFVAKPIGRLGGREYNCGIGLNTRRFSAVS